MPVLLAGLVSGLSTVALNILIKVISNPVFIKKVLVLVAERLVAVTPTDVDDKMLEFAKQILDEHDAAADEKK